MILTVTMNPSVDTRYQLDELVIDDVNRVTPEKTAGGKGLNVARVLGQLGDDVVATGLLGGHMGAYMAELMDANGINNDFVPIKGETPHLPQHPPRRQPDRAAGERPDHCPRGARCLHRQVH